MKNLLEKLKPEILKEIDNSYDTYPNIVKDLKEELSSLYYVSDIKYGTIIQLDNYYLSTFNQLPNNGWQNFINE